MPGRPTLAEQLAAIRDDAPTEYDPESVGYSFSKGDSLADSLDAGRADYVDVGESKLRKNLDTELGGKYAGVKASRSQLYNDDVSEENIEEEDDDDDVSDDGESAGEKHSSEDDEQLSFEAEQGDDTSAFSDEDVDSDAEEAMQPDAHAATRKVTLKARSGKARAVEADSQAMLQELKKASSADIEKGTDVRKQLSFWDTLLEARIRMQKCVQGINTIPSPSDLPAYKAESSMEHTRAVSSLEELSEMLFTLQQELYQTNEKLSLPDSISSANNDRKRKRGTAGYLHSTLASLDDMSQATAAHKKGTVNKWSEKVASASSAGNAGNKFKAIGAQNTWTQIENMLSQDMERLVERTKIRRGNAGGKIVKVVGRDKVHEPVEGEKDIDPDVYDDTDFYQTLLREVVDHLNPNGTLGGADGGAYANFNNTSRKKASSTLDVKASKGRKIRYHVHEKLMNFMPPIPTDLWEKEQIDELFRGLLGVHDSLQDQDEEVQTLGTAETGENARIRIF